MGIKLLLRELGELFQINRDTRNIEIWSLGSLKNIIDGEVFVRLGNINQKYRDKSCVGLLNCPMLYNLLIQNYAV